MKQPGWLRGIALALLLSCGGLAQGVAQAQDARPSSVPAPRLASQAVVARNGMVVAQEARAARIGADILARGGNAVDAAVASGFALAVTYPRAGNLGGGGFMLVHMAARNETVAIDCRESAPQGATPTMFLDADGKPDPARSRDSALAVGVPGTVAGLALAHARYGSGRFTLAELIAPAIHLARDGVLVGDDTADTLPQARERLMRWPSSAKLFLHGDGTPLGEGEVLVQEDLARTLEAIAAAGADGFYRGAVAEKLVAAVQSAGGLLTLDDLAGYRAVVRAPVTGFYRGHGIAAMSPPSSGGAVLIETLNILEGYDLGANGGTDAPHLMIEAMKRAYADRAFFLGDPAFTAAPLARLISKDYAAALRRDIDPQRARPSSSIRREGAGPREGGNTTHVSIADRFGNAVAHTTTLNFGYGLGLVAEGTGVLLNNEMDDFTAAPGAANAFGLVGYEANLPGPGKRPLSSMTPAIVFRDGRPMLITGSPGGSRIISAVTQVISNVLDHGMDIAAAVAAPRLHHQWMPDEVRVERGVAPALVEDLRRRGHAVAEPLGETSANSIRIGADGFHGAADPRTRGALAAGVD
ncbi:MAG: gamma-glutamyltransferase [Xanthobacteraceae bacterium]|nr:MAG: gamma-glutamyltransferase [Xanthobacteraceae bacterium]